MLNKQIHLYASWLIYKMILALLMKQLLKVMFKIQEKLTTNHYLQMYG